MISPMATFLRFNRLVRPIPSSTVCTDSERAAIVAIAAGLLHAGGDCDAPLFAGVVLASFAQLGIVLEERILRQVRNARRRIQP
jgi:hypothetical protein